MNIISNTGTITVGSVCLYSSSGRLGFGIVQYIGEDQYDPLYPDEIVTPYQIKDLNVWLNIYLYNTIFVLNSTVINNLLSKYSAKEHSPVQPAFDICNQNINHNDVCITNSIDNKFYYAFNYNDFFKKLVLTKRVFKIDSTTLDRIMLLKLKYG